MPFVMQFYGSPSSYLWEDQDGVEHTITQAEGGEQGDPLMPALFSALQALQAQLQEDERFFAFLDDVYVVCSLERCPIRTGGRRHRVFWQTSGIADSSATTSLTFSDAIKLAANMLPFIDLEVNTACNSSFKDSLFSRPCLDWCATDMRNLKRAAHTDSVQPVKKRQTCDPSFDDIRVPFDTWVLQLLNGVLSRHYQRKNRPTIHSRSAARCWPEHAQSRSCKNRSVWCKFIPSTVRPPIAAISLRKATLVPSSAMSQQSSDSQDSIVVEKLAYEELPNISRMISALRSAGVIERQLDSLPRSHDPVASAPASRTGQK